MLGTGGGGLTGRVGALESFNTPTDIAESNAKILANTPTTFTGFVADVIGRINGSITQVGVLTSSKVKNLFYASPSTGTGTPGFRVIDIADLPTKIPVAKIDLAGDADKANKLYTQKEIDAMFKIVEFEATATAKIGTTDVGTYKVYCRYDPNMRIMYVKQANTVQFEVAAGVSGQPIVSVALPAKYQPKIQYQGSSENQHLWGVAKGQFTWDYQPANFYLTTNANVATWEWGMTALSWNTVSKVSTTVKEMVAFNISGTYFVK
jgi:hypothetical protein